MRQSPQRLLQNEAAVRLLHVETPPLKLACQREIIQRGIVATQTQPKAVLAGRRAMTGPGVAAGLGERGNDVSGEADGLRRLHTLDPNWHTRLLLTELGHEDRFAIASGRDS